jgi:hypothetical protein
MLRSTTAQIPSEREFCGTVVLRLGGRVPRSAAGDRRGPRVVGFGPGGGPGRAPAGRDRWENLARIGTRRRARTASTCGVGPHPRGSSGNGPQVWPACASPSCASRAPPTSPKPYATTPEGPTGHSKRSSANPSSDFAGALGSLSPLANNLARTASCASVSSTAEPGFGARARSSESCGVRRG